MNQLAVYVLFIIVYIILDLIWLKGGSSLHQSTYESVTRTKQQINLNYQAGFLFYLIAPLAYFLLIKPLVEAKEAKLSYVFGYGALIGLLMYGAYDLTSKAVYNEAYPWSYALFDMTWGCFVFGLVSTIVFTVEQNHQ